MELSIEGILNAFPRDWVIRGVQDGLLLGLILVLTRRAYIFFWPGPASYLSKERRLSAWEAEEPDLREKVANSKAEGRGLKARLELLLAELNRESKRVSAEKETKASAPVPQVVAAPVVMAVPAPPQFSPALPTSSLPVPPPPPLAGT